MPVLSTFDAIKCMPFYNNMAEHSKQILKIIKLLDQSLVSESGQDEHYPPPLIHFNMADETTGMWEVLAHENKESQENIVMEVSHAYLIFFFYLHRFIGAHFTCTLCIFPSFQNSFYEFSILGFGPIYKFQGSCHWE